MLLLSLVIVISYLIGAIPFAYLFGRLKGIDLRKFGSGNIGATNALRVLGKEIGISVLLLDMLKGFVVVVFLGDLLSLRTPNLSDDLLRIILGISAICGHIWTIFLNFKGGKGVATTFGVLLGLAIKIKGFFLVFIAVILTWIIVFLLVRIVSVSSLVAAITLPIYILIFKPTKIFFLLSILICLLVIWRHKSNIKRILAGKEPRLF